MRFALRAAPLCAALLLTAAAPPAHLRGVATSTIDGVTRTVTVERDGADRLVRSCSAGVCSGTWVAAGRRYTFGLNEQPLPDDALPAPPDPLTAEAERAARPVAGRLTPPAGLPLELRARGELPLADARVPIVPCSLAGRPVRCLIDSGSTPSALTLGLAESLGLPPQGSLLIAAFGDYAAGVVSSGPLSMGPARFPRLRFAVAPVGVDTPWDVLVGADLLARLRVTIDRRARRLSIGPSGETGPATIPLTFSAGLPFVDLDWGDGRRPALLDSGDEAIVSLGYDAYRRGTPWPVAGRGRAGGVAGGDDTLLVDVPAVTAGTLALGEIRAVVRRTQHTPHLGAGLAGRCVLTIDEGARAATCTPGPASSR